MMLIAGVEQATSGHIHVAGKDITHLSEDALAAFRSQHIGVVFQHFHLIPTMTALENVKTALELSGASDITTQAKAALEQVGLSERMHHYPAQLSGGEQQRVALARAFATKPSILLTDEPTGNLDSETGNHIMELLLGMQREHGTTLILITHDPALAKQADRQFVVQNGMLVQQHMSAS